MSENTLCPPMSRPEFFEIYDFDNPASEPMIAGGRQSHLLDELYEQWRSACRSIDEYQSKGKIAHVNIRSNRFDGWLEGFAHAAFRMGQTEAYETARFLGSVWIYRTTP